MTKKVRVVGAIASSNGVTLYLEDGQEHNLKLDSIKSKAILDEAIPRLAKHKVVEMDLESFSSEAMIEKKSGGFLRFVREKVKKIGGFFHLGNDEPAPVVPHPTSGGIVNGKPFIKVDTSASSTIEEVETLVAYVGDKRIPGAEALSKQMERAAYGSGYAGFELFMKRLASVIDSRGHSVQELLRFMERADLPIADDGSIVGYKVLTTYGQGPNKFVDCHTKRVTQQLGSYVHMKESSVDPSRRTQCSTGLHIARRAYLKGFHGDIITIVKIAPEDVIAVPFNEPDKMRAAAYHIVQVLPAEVHEILRSNKPMTGHELASRLLGDAIAGRHVGILEDVFIGGPNGNDVTITPRTDGAAAPATVGETLARALDDTEQVSIKEIRQAADAAYDAPDDPLPDEVLAAAASGDLAAAINAAAPEVAEVATEIVEAIAETPIAATETAAEPVKTAPAKKARAKKASTPVASPAAPAKVAKAIKPEAELPENWRKALALLDQGLSGREVAQQVTICRKTLGKLKKTYRPDKADE